MPGWRLASRHYRGDEYAIQCYSDSYIIPIRVNDNMNLEKPLVGFCSCSYSLETGLHPCKTHLGKTAMKGHFTAAQTLL